MPWIVTRSTESWAWQTRQTVKLRKRYARDTPESNARQELLESGSHMDLTIIKVVLEFRIGWQVQLRIWLYGRHA